MTTFGKKHSCESMISTEINQKGECQNGCFKTTKHAKFSEKQTFLTPWYIHTHTHTHTHTHSFSKFGVLCFLEKPILRFVLLLYYQRYQLFWNHTFSSQMSSWEFFVCFRGLLLLFICCHDGIYFLYCYWFISLN